MNWQDEGYLLSKNIFDENSIIIEAFTLNHGKFNGIIKGVYVAQKQISLIDGVKYTEGIINISSIKFLFSLISEGISG